MMSRTGFNIKPVEIYVVGRQFIFMCAGVRAYVTFFHFAFPAAHETGDQVEIN